MIVLGRIQRSKKSSDAKGDFITYDDFNFKAALIKKVTVESPTVKSFYLDTPISKIPQPGQFMMVWLPDFEEVPMSVSGADDKYVRISVAKKGPTTNELNKSKKGKALFVRGPFGNQFLFDSSSYLLVGGGHGAAPLIYAAKMISKLRKRVTYVIGAKSSAELLYLKEARKLGVKSHVATEDGSAGHHGLVTELLGKLLDEGRFDSILTCGPEPMMYKVVQEGLKRGVRVQASLERYMKCGFGICGSCVLDPVGMRVCVDGPIFDGASLMNTDFGKTKRDASGSKVEI